ncbi:hypothetical protein cypCar_00048872, partial [Cyprinus carpio]
GAESCLVGQREGDGCFQLHYTDFKDSYHHRSRLFMNTAFGKQLKMKNCKIFLFLLLMIMAVSTNAQEVTCEGEQLINVDIVVGNPGKAPPYKPGHILVFRCTDVNLKMHGQRTIECLSNGKWDYHIHVEIFLFLETKCVANLSENMRSDEHWGSEVSVRPGQTITLSCVRRGYTLQGQEKITCQSNGEWSSAFPKCEETKCVANLSENMRSDEHRGSEVSVRPGQTITLSCVRRGYTLQGQEKITCQSNGEWSSPFPKCISQTTSCGPPPEVDYADTIELKKDEYKTRERVEYSCFNKYTLDLRPSFSRYLTCEQGEWRGNIRCLKPCTVTVEEMNRRGIDLAYADRQKMFAPHNDYITFACQRGKVLAGVRELRQQCDDGVITLPECVGRWG